MEASSLWLPDIRVTATSNRDLRKQWPKVHLGRSSYRLNVFRLRFALRQRLKTSCRWSGGLLSMASALGVAGFPAEAGIALHPWPGNVRELENVVQRALILRPEPPSSPSIWPVEALPPAAAGGREPSVKPEDNKEGIWSATTFFVPLAEVGGSRKLARRASGDLRAHPSASCCNNIATKLLFSG